ncbi:hypothetical protein PPYR_13135 [Photinus pyralis]|uniref:Uncharacterized protein n=1 Tax=Photinus pyralis TaxID=7054 RepID=A0A5N4A875_PHOPY|nr:uncharacterized protein LOC116179758 [Photinus pyralis]KAB0793515.1 hypothetical protein PPYR_13135 [Photinus pyralis]
MKTLLVINFSVLLFFGISPAVHAAENLTDLKPLLDTLVKNLLACTSDVKITNITAIIDKNSKCAATTGETILQEYLSCLLGLLMESLTNLLKNLTGIQKLLFDILKPVLGLVSALLFILGKTLAPVVGAVTNLLTGLLKNEPIKACMQQNTPCDSPLLKLPLIGDLLKSLLKC